MNCFSICESVLKLPAPKRIFASYAFFIINYAIQSVCGLIIARIYLAEIFGQYSFFMGLCVFLSALTQLGTTQSFVALSSQCADAKKLIIPFYVIRLVGFAVVAILAAASFIAFSSQTIAFVTLLFLLPLTLNAHPILDYYGHTIDDVKINFLYDTLIFLLIFAILVPFKVNIGYVVLAKAASRMLAEIIKYFHIKTKIGIKEFSGRYFKWYLARSKIFFYNRLIVEAYGRSEVILLGLLAPKAELGIYCAAQAFVDAAVFANGLIARVLFAHLSKASSDYEKSSEVLRRSICLNSLILVPIVLATWAFGSKFIFSYILTDPAYHRSIHLLNILIITLIPTIFANHTNILLFSPKRSAYPSVFLLGLILNGIMACSAYMFYSLEGYAIAMQLVRIICITCSIKGSISQVRYLKNASGI